MGHSGGSSVVDQVGNSLGNYAKGVANYLGWNTDGKNWKFDGKEGFIHMDDEAFGEIDGRNKARAALNQDQDHFNIAQAQAADLVAQQNWNKQNADNTGSAGAAAATATAKGASGLNYNNTTPLALGPGATNPSTAGKDFLGL